MIQDILRINKKSYAALELIISIIIVVVLMGAMFSMITHFTHHRQLETAAINLREDIIQTQQFARARRDGYKYYGVHLFDDLGEEGDRAGYKIVRYEPIDLESPFNPITQELTIIKSCDEADDSEFIEDTFFGKHVQFHAESELTVGSAIVFNSQGSATSNGRDLLESDADEIILGLSGNRGTMTVSIVPLVGYIEIE